MGCRRNKRSAPAPDSLVDPEELARLDRDLQAFFEACPSKHGWVQHANIREYLAPGRIAFYHRIVDLLTTHGVQVDYKRVADVGTCTGYLLRLLADRFPHALLFGYDINPRLIQLSGALCTGAQVEEGNIADGIPGTFDVVLATEVLEHLKRPRQALGNLLGMLEKGGTLALTVPDGRVDRQPAGNVKADGMSFTGHVNFWSLESWDVFLEESCAGCECKTGRLGESGLYGLVRMR